MKKEFIDDFDKMSGAECRLVIRMAQEQLASLENYPVALYANKEQVRERPRGGAVLFYYSPISSQIFEDWYPTRELAKNALVEMANQAGKTIQDDEQGLRADLTPHGAGQQSYAEVRV